MDLATLVMMSLLQITGPSEVTITQTSMVTLEECWDTAQKVNVDPSIPFIVVCSPTIPTAQANEAPTPTPNS